MLEATCVMLAIILLLVGVFCLMLLSLLSYVSEIIVCMHVHVDMDDLV